MESGRSSLFWSLAGAAALAASLMYSAGRGGIVLGERPEPEEAPVVANGTGTKAVGGGGQVTVLEFFASWCAGCSREVPASERVARAEGAEWIGVSLDDSAADARKAAATWGIAGIVVHDADRKLRETYHVHAVPALVVLDERGMATFSTTGGVSARELARRIDEARSLRPTGKRRAAR